VKKKEVLILVHPGSACGSANFNLGKTSAASGRDGLILDLELSAGHVFVIDGEFSDEIENYEKFCAAINDALKRAHDRGDFAERIMGDDNDDFNQVAAAQTLIKRHGLSTTKHHVLLTGAWFDPDGKHGCVNSVYEVFSQLGFTVDVMDGALSLDDGFDAECEDESSLKI